MEAFSFFYTYLDYLLFSLSFCVCVWMGGCWVRLGGVDKKDWSSYSGDKKEARRLPVPNSILAALARDDPPPESGSGSGGAGTPSSGSSSRGAMKSWSGEVLHESDKPSGFTCCLCRHAIVHTVRHPSNGACSS